MEIRSLSVIRFAKDIPFVKKAHNSKSPFEFEASFIELGKPRGLIYCGLVGDFSGRKTKALMKCGIIKHKYFSLIIGDLKKGSGCPECGIRLMKSKQKSNEGDVVREIDEECARRGTIKFIGFDGGYVNIKEKNLKFECLLGHGEHLTSLVLFRRGCGCPVCGVNRRAEKNTIPFDQIMKIVNDFCSSKGNLEFVRFEGGYKKVAEVNLYLRCTDHNKEFKTSVARIITDCAGCWECGVEHRASSQKIGEQQALATVIAECEAKQTYANPLFVGGYIRSHERNLKIDCLECGQPFMTTYIDFTNGVGCPFCVKCGFRRNKPGYVYIQKITGDVNAGKIGITNKTPEKRMVEHKRASKLNHEIVFSHYFEDGNKVWEIEKLVKSTLKDKMRFVPRELMEDGYTETFPIELLTPVLNEVKSICCK
ncbi:TPA: GIY-YIG nuclease family protein [Escherichia coli]